VLSNLLALDLCLDILLSNFLVLDLGHIIMRQEGSEAIVKAKIQDKEIA
jgi:hypothetical protein